METISKTPNEEESYIDMEITMSSPQQQFEFKMSSSPSQYKENKTSPADELFYKGKLLPLYLPPRLQMVQNLLFDPKNTNSNMKASAFGHVLVQEEAISSNISSDGTAYATNSTRTDTPLDSCTSCTISPTASCRVCSELNPEEYFFDWSTTQINNTFTNGGGESLKKKSFWVKKFKKSSLGHRLKASSSYLRSLFTKHACTNESCCTKEMRNNVEANSYIHPEHVTPWVSNNIMLYNILAPCNQSGNDAPDICKNHLKVKAECASTTTKGVNKYIEVMNNKKPFLRSDSYEKFRKENSLMKRTEREMSNEDGGGFCAKRRSFSGAIQWHSAIKCLSSSGSSSGFSSSSSFSSYNNGLYDHQCYKRSSSSSSEVESSIEGAIAYCKRSQQLFSPKRTDTEVGVWSFPVPGLIQAYGDQERPKMCND